MMKQATTFTTPMYPNLTVRNMHIQPQLCYPPNPTFADQLIPTGGWPLWVSFLSYGDNQEDSLVFHEEFIKRAGFTCVTLSNLSSETEKNEKFGLSQDMKLTMSQSGNISKLRGETVPIGTIITAGDVVIAKYAETESSEIVENSKNRYVDRSLIYDGYDDAYVYGIQKVPGRVGGQKIIVMIRSLRHPNVGSKFCSPNGNKGVISKILPTAMMPCGLLTGRVPDYCVNPHSFPSRILPGEAMADLAGLIASITGTCIDTTIFNDLTLDHLIGNMRNIEVAPKWKEYYTENPFGYELMRNRDGIITQATVLTFTVRQALQKYAELEMSARTRGPLDPLTRQTLAGSKNKGGQRAGEMEMWVIASAGATNFSNELTKLGETRFYIYVCRGCGTRAVYNEDKDIYYCRKCEGATDIGMFGTHYGANSFWHYIDALNLDMLVKLEPYKEYDFVE